MSEINNNVESSDKYKPERKQNETVKKVKKWFDNKLIPSLGKLGNQTHLSGIRDSFGTMIPLLVAGSIGLLMGFIVFGNGGTGQVSLLGLLAKAVTGWSWDNINNFGAAIDPGNGWEMTSKIGGAMFSVLSDITIGAMSIYFAFLFGYFIATTRAARQPIMAGFVSLGAFWIANMGQIAWSSGAQGLISAIIFGIIATELFVWLTKVEKLKINLPAGVPPAIGAAFSLLVPIIITFLTVAVSNIIVLAPAIASTGWTVDAQKSLEVGAGKFLEQWTNKELTLEYLTSLAKGTVWENQPVIVELISKWGIGDITTEAGAQEFINWFNNLSNSDTSLVSTFMSVKIFGLDPSKIATLTEFANANLVFMPGIDDTGQGILAVFSYQEIQVGSDKFGWGQAIFKFFTSWFISLAMSDAGLALALVSTFFASFFWFFGVHGANVMASIFDPIWYMITAINVALYTSLGMDAAIATGEMGYWGANWGKWFVDIGGSGGTLALIIMTWVFSARREFKELGKYAFPAGLFGINEPVIFGWPLVLNGRYAIPFIFIPIISIFPYYIFGPVLEWINPPVLMLPWTTPSFLGAVLANLDVKSLVPFFISFAIQLALWTPFIILDNKLTFKKMKIEEPERYEEEMKYRTDKDYRNEVKAANKQKLIEEKALAKERAEKRKQRDADRKAESQK